MNIPYSMGSSTQAQIPATIQATRFKTDIDNPPTHFGADDTPAAHLEGNGIGVSGRAPTLIKGTMLRMTLSMIALATALSACGGGAGSSQPESQAAVSTSSKSVQIDAHGDSTMASYTNPATGPYITTPTVTQMLQADLQAALGSGYLVSVNNFGANGATVCDLVQGSGRYSIPLSKSLQTSAAGYVLENFGLNDSNPTVSNETTTQFEQCVEQFVDTARASGKTPILEESNPIGSAPREPGFDNTRLLAYVAIVRYVAQTKGVQIVSQYDNFQTLANWQTLLSDGIHPTEQGYTDKAQFSADTLVPILR